MDFQVNVINTAVGEMPTDAVRSLQAELLPCLIFEAGLRDGGVVAVEDREISVGRSLTNELVLEGETVSRKHCMLAGQGASLKIQDLGSTNGTYVNERPLNTSHELEVGDLVQIGDHTLRYTLRSRAEVRSSEAKEADLDRAARYVTSLLPPRIERGPVIVDWEFAPSLGLGGDIFSYRTFERGMTVYLLEVKGSGIGAAMHATAIHSVLAQGPVQGLDMTSPGQVLAFLNDRFAMEHHEGLCFSFWYGYYDTPARKLTYASGGHHPALMVSPDRRHVIPLQTQNPVLGALKGHQFAGASIDIPPCWNVYLFSDGAYDFTGKDGRQCTLSDFEKLIRIEGPVAPGEPSRILGELQKEWQGPHQDDCSILTMTFV